MFTERPVLWLLPEHLHFHHDHDVKVKVISGTAMKGGAAVPSVTGCVVGPAGKVVELTPARDGENVYFHFPPGEEGIYTVTAGTEGGSARLLVEVGHHVHGDGKALGRGLEILPLHYHEFRMSDTVELQVLFDGTPVERPVVYAVSHLHEGTGYSHRVETGEKGIVKFSFPEKGHWLFAAEVVTETGAKIFATLVVPGVR